MLAHTSASLGQSAAPVVWLAGLTAVALIYALSGRPWRILLRPESQNAALGTVVLLTTVWLIRARFPGAISGAMAAGVPVQLLGATLTVVMFGLRPALLLLALVAAASTWVLAGEGGSIGGWDWAAALGRYVWLGVVPACVSALAQELTRRWLPRNIFIFIFFHGYFAAALAVAVSAVTGALVWSFTPPANSGAGFAGAELAAAIATLAFAEGFLTGMLVAVFVVYCPNWVATFEDSVYLRAPRASSAGTSGRSGEP